jgi:hypothetical protein
MLENLEPPVKVLPCKVRRLLSQLDNKDKQILESAMADSKWSPYLLAQALEARDVKISDKSLKKHMTNSCSCAEMS